VLRYVDLTTGGGAARDGTVDDQAAFQNAVDSTAVVYVPAGTYRIESEVTLASNTTMYGDGQGKSILTFYHAANPASSEFMLAARSKDSILIHSLTLDSNAYEDGLFDVGTYTSATPPEYTGSGNGNINGVLISSCTNVTVKDCELRHFNYHGIRVSVEGSTPATHYNKNLVFDRLWGHHCRNAPLSVLGTLGVKITNCTMEDTGYFDANVIDCGTGYGIVIGRQPSASQLRTYGAIVSGNYCARNARHGIDCHSGGNVIIDSNICVDNVLDGILVQDISGSADDANYVGDIKVTNNTIYDTVWSESQFSLVSATSPGVERNDSIPIFVSSVGNSLLRNIQVSNNNVNNFRFRQLAANVAGTDTVGCLTVTCEDSAVVTGNCFEVYADTDYLPSYGMEISADNWTVTGNVWKYKQRSTVEKPFFRFAATAGAGFFNSNHVDCQGTYSDSGAVTPAAWPIFELVSGEISFVGNSIIQPTQSTRGSLWKTATDNTLWGFNGVLSTNHGNMLKLNGSTWMEYASRIQGSLTIYVTDAGAGIQDGMSNSTQFDGGTTPGTFGNIISDMPLCDSGLIVMIEDDQLDWGSTGGITLPAWQDNITFRGLTSETSNSMTKTGGIKTTGNNLIDCNGKDKNISFEYLYLKSDGVQVINDAKDVQYCAIEQTDTAGIGLLFQGGNHYVRGNRFQGPGSGTGKAISILEGGSLVSQVNDDGATKFAYALNANSSAIYKNSTQPTGATANELAQNGGTVA
jgi:hypothetical protein